MTTALTSHRRDLLIVGVIALIARVLLFAVYGPAVEMDSHEYLAVGQQLLGMNLGDYTGRRTPVYPLCAALFGGIPWLIHMVQALCGVAASMMAADIARRMTASRLVMFACGLCCALALPVLLAEAAILTESLTSVLLIALLWLYLRWRDDIAKGMSRSRYIVLMGSIAALLVLLRPQFAFVPLVVIIAVGLVLRKNAMPLRQMVMVTLIAGIPVVAWAGFNAAVTGVYAIATGGGFSMTNHTIGYMEDAPDAFGRERDILIQHRTQRIAEAGTPLMTISRAMPDLRKTTGLNDARLAKRLGEMNTALIVRNPGTYAASVVVSWARFWSVRTMLLRSGTDSETTYSFLAVVVTIWRYGLMLANAVFLMLVAASIVPVIRRRALSLPGIWFAMALILGSSLMQALAERGENARYGMPTQMLVVIVLAAAMWSLYKGRKEYSAG